MLRVVKNTRTMSVRTIRPIARTSKFSRSMRAARRPTVGPKIRVANAYCIRTRRVPKSAGKPGRKLAHPEGEVRTRDEPVDEDRLGEARGPVQRRRDPVAGCDHLAGSLGVGPDRKSTRLNSSHGYISYAVFCLKKKKKDKSTECSRQRLMQN